MSIRWLGCGEFGRVEDIHPLVKCSTPKPSDTLWPWPSWSPSNRQSATLLCRELKTGVHKVWINQLKKDKLLLMKTALYRSSLCLQSFLAFGKSSGWSAYDRRVCSSHAGPDDHHWYSGVCGNHGNHPYDLYITNNGWVPSIQTLLGGTSTQNEVCINYITIHHRGNRFSSNIFLKLVTESFVSIYAGARKNFLLFSQSK